MTDRRTKEAIRYLGYGKQIVDERTLHLIAEVFEELERESEVRWVYRVLEIKQEKEGTILIGPARIISEKLGKNLRECQKAIVFAITLGVEIDRRIRRYSLADPARAVVMQACAAAYLEECCDRCQKELSDNLVCGFLLPRFSPGYGDFDIKHQEDFLNLLDAAKTIGLSRTESYMLIPAKSVTAVMGISQTKEDCHVRGCECCEKTDCMYRRN